MFNRQIKEDLQFHKAVLRRFERLIGNNNKEIIELKERLEIYEEQLPNTNAPREEKQDGERQKRCQCKEK